MGREEVGSPCELCLCIFCLFYFSCSTFKEKRWLQQLEIARVLAKKSVSNLTVQGGPAKCENLPEILLWNATSALVWSMIWSNRVSISNVNMSKYVSSATWLQPGVEHLTTSFLRHCIIQSSLEEPNPQNDYILKGCLRLAHKMLGWSNSSSIQEDGQFHHSHLVPRQEGFLVFTSAARRKWIFLSGKKCSSSNNNRGNWGTRASRQEAKFSPGTPYLWLLWCSE